MINFKPLYFYGCSNELAKGIQDKIPWCVLFACEIVLMDELQGVSKQVEVVTPHDTPKSQQF